MQGTRKIVKKNILYNIRYIAINASGKSIVETKNLCFDLNFYGTCVCGVTS